jgi:hypothetical protein
VCEACESVAEAVYALDESADVGVEVHAGHAHVFAALRSILSFGVSGDTGDGPFAAAGRL